MLILNNKKTKKILLTTLTFTLIGIGIFLFTKYGIALRQLEKQEIAEQIEKLGYYRADFHINPEREILQHKYQLMIGIPMFITLMITIPMLIFNLFEIFNNNKGEN